MLFIAGKHTEKRNRKQNCQLFLKLHDSSKVLYSKYTEDGRSMATFYCCTVNHQSGLQRNTFSKLLYILLIHQNVPQIMSFHLSYMMVS